MLNKNLMTEGLAGLLTVCGMLAGCPLHAQDRASDICAWGIDAFHSGGVNGKIASMSADLSVTALLRSDGRLFVNGYNFNARANVPPLPPGRRYVAMEVNYYGGGAVLDDGSVVVWAAQYSLLYPVAQMAPPPLPAGMKYVDIAVGSSAVLAKRSDGSVLAWGSNQYGECNVPAIPTGRSVARLHAFRALRYLILDDGTVLTFGYDSGGQALPPTPPSGVGYDHIQYCNDGQGRETWLALRTDGEIVGWGDNLYGACDAPTLPAGTVYTAAATDTYRGYAGRSDGVVMNWYAWPGGPQVVTTTVLPQGVTCTHIDGSTGHMVALLSNGDIMELSAGNSTFPRMPVLERERIGGMRPWFVDVAISYGGGAAAVLSNGRLDVFAFYYAPPASFSQQKFQRVSLGWQHGAAMTTSGDVLAWGNNLYGQCNVPPLPPGMQYIDFDCTDFNTALVRSDGQAIVIGDAAVGQTAVPPLPLGTRYVSCEMSDGRTALLRSDGQLLSFGWGQGSLQNNIPSLPPGLEYIDVGAARGRTLVLRSDGQAEFTTPPSPVPGWQGVPALPFGVYYVEAAGGDGAVALRRSDGRAVGCGIVDGVFDYPPQLEPGTSFLYVGAGPSCCIGRIGAASTYVGIAAGCAGSRPASRLVPRDTPKIGRTLEVRVFDLPVDLTMLVMSFQQLPQPVSLAPLGMPGCEIHIPLDAAVLLAGQNHVAKARIPIPDRPQLMGMQFFQQALVLDPQAGNGFGAVVSDTARGVVGDR